jgi:hypothetical protein
MTTPGKDEPFKGQAVSDWRRRVLRRQVLRGMAGGAGLAFGAGMGLPLSVLAYDPPTGSEPRAIPQILRGTHHFPPGHGREITTIADFSGIVGGGQLTGTGFATNTATGATTKLNFSVDNRFLIGDYVAANGVVLHGTFGVL